MRRFAYFLWPVLFALLMLAVQQFAVMHVYVHLGEGAGLAQARSEAAHPHGSGDHDRHGDACPDCLALAGMGSAPVSVLLAFAPVPPVQRLQAIAVPPAPTFEYLIFFNSRAPPLLQS